MDSEIIGAIISSTATIFTAIIGGWFAIKVKDMELKAKEARTGEILTQAEKKAAHWLWGIIGAGAGVVIGIAIMAIAGNLSFLSTLPPKIETPVIEASIIESPTVELSAELPCASVNVGQVEELKRFEDVVEAIRQAEQFAGYRQNDYRKGEIIPANVLIATDLRSSNIEQFDVIPITNQGGWGLFITSRELTAPNAGTYWCIRSAQIDVSQPTAAPSSTLSPETVNSGFSWVTQEVRVLEGITVNWHECPEPNCVWWNTYEHSDGSFVPMEILRCKQDGAWVDESNIEHTGLDIGVHSKVAGITVRKCP